MIEICSNENNNQTLAISSSLLISKSLSMWRMELLILTFLIISIIIYYLEVFLRWGQLWKCGLAGPPPLPFIGSFYTCLRADDVPKLLHLGRKFYGKSYIFWKCLTPCVFTSDTELIQRILWNPMHVGKAEGYQNADFLMAHGLLTSNASEWRRDRRIILPGIKSPSLYSSTFLPIFNKNSKILLSILKDKFSSTTGQFVQEDIFKDIARCTMQIVFETLLGFPVEIQRRQELKWVEAALMCSELIRLKMFQPWIKFPILWNLLGYSKQQEESIRIIKTAFQQLQLYRRMDSESDKPNVMELLENHFGKNGEELFGHFTSIVGAGFETTATVLNNTLFLLALNDEVQRKLQREIDEYFPNAEDDDDFEFSFDDLKHLEFMESVLKESMRLLSPAPLLGRTLGCDLPLDYDGNCEKKLPKGCQIMISTWQLHHDPDLYSNPMDFVPERWSKNNTIDSRSFIPFSGGPRGCFGEKYANTEMKIILTRILLKFNISSKLKFSDVKYRFGIVLNPIGGLSISLSPRR